MRFLVGLFFFSYSFCLQADTMDHYMNISNNIAQMEMKADPQAQAWARAARNILIITNESIAETLIQANELAKSQGRPLFCLPPGIDLNATTLSGLILQTYREISSQQSDKDKMTISQVAWLGVTKNYLCQGSTRVNQMEKLGYIAQMR
jgi:hypothetical protein